MMHGDIETAGGRCLVPSQTNFLRFAIAISTAPRPPVNRIRARTQKIKSTCAKSLIENVMMLR